MPTTSLPGIGASIRIERAARAIARSSARRLDAADTLTWCSGRTSYWVTTGPELRPRPWPGSRSSRASPRCCRMFDSWSSVAAAGPAAAGGSSSSIGGRRPVDRARATRGRSATSRRSPSAHGSAARPRAVADARRTAARRAAVGGPVQTVWLTGDWAVGRRRLVEDAAGADRRARPGVGLGTATGGLAAAASAAAARRAPAAARSPRRWARARIERGRRRADPAAPRRDTGASSSRSRQVEREHQPDHDRARAARRTRRAP